MEKMENDKILMDSGLKVFLENTSDMMFVKDVDSRYIGASVSFCHMVGKSCADEIIGKKDIDIFNDKSLAERYLDDDRRLLESKQSILNYIEPLPYVNHEPRYSSTSKHILLDSNGVIKGICGISKDITLEYRAKLEYERELQYLFNLPKNALTSALLDLTDWRLIDLRNKDKTNTYAVSSFSTVDGFAKFVVDTISEDCNAKKFFANFTKANLFNYYDNEKRSFEFEYERFFPDGTLKWVKLTLNFLIDPITEHITIIIVLYDIDNVKSMLKDLEYSATHDAMTGLLNREYTMKSIESFLQNNEESREDLNCLFLIDIDNFKLINDTFGHKAGDYVIAKVAEKMIESFRECDILGRVGGDEFFVFMKNVKKLDFIKEKAEELKRYFDSEPIIFDQPFDVSLSCGISLLYGNSKSLDQLYAEADDALYQAKFNGKNQYKIYAKNEYLFEEKDALTVLCNRRTFYLNAKETLEENPKTKYIIIRFDIDRFKAYNDIYGVKEGDLLLKNIALAIKSVPQSKNWVLGRIESDHFVILMPKSDMNFSTWSPSFSQWTDDYVPKCHLIYSFGIYEIDNPNIEVTLMCDRAKIALKTVKDKYTDKVAWYNESLRVKLLEEQAMIDEVEEAIQHNQFVVYFQPQVDYETGALIGAEALVRWQHPKRGFITPDKFIPLFEKNGFILRLDEYVWDKVCTYIKKWEKMLSSFPFAVSINISQIDLMNPHLCRKLCDLVEKYEIPYTSLKLEITESAYMDNPHLLINTVKELQNVGFIVEMDDFGKGYSSLNMLKDVPVNVLKLDMQFLSKSSDSSRAGTILSSVIRMANWLKIPVIAEGVETKEQAEFLKNLGCYYMQGYFFSKPMSVENFEKELMSAIFSKNDRYKNNEMSIIPEFWNMSSYSGNFSSNQITAYCILECSDNSVVILYANDIFYATIGITRSDYRDSGSELLNCFDDDNKKIFLNMLEEAIKNNVESYAEIERRPLMAKAKLLTKNKARLLASGENRYILHVSVSRVEVISPE